MNTEKTNSGTNGALRVMLEKVVEEFEMSERRFGTLIEKSQDMVTLASADGEIIYASPAISRVLGYSIDEFEGKKLFELFHPDEQEEYLEKRRGIIDTPGSSIYHQLRIRHKDGKWIWCEGTVSNLLEEKGVNAIVCNFRDITQSKVTKEILEQSERRFRDFFENAPEGITILDVSTMKFVAWNSNALKLTKFTEDEMRAKGPGDMYPEFQLDGQRSDEKAMEFIARAVQGEKLVFEWLSMDAEGKPLMVEVRLVRIDGASSPQLYASFVDITERKKTEALLLEQNKRLSEVSFLQSHQVRKPIAHILGLINLLNVEDATDPANAEVIAKIKEVTNNFDTIIHEIVQKTNQINWTLNFR